MQHPHEFDVKMTRQNRHYHGKVNTIKRYLSVLKQ